jgi:hypothetical protein
MPGGGELEEGRDPVTGMSVERVERADGRYLIYYGWPAEPEAPNANTSPQESTQGAPDV